MAARKGREVEGALPARLSAPAASPARPKEGFEVGGRGEHNTASVVGGGNRAAVSCPGA